MADVAGEEAWRGLFPVIRSLRDGITHMYCSKAELTV